MSSERRTRHRIHAGKMQQLPPLAQNLAREISKNMFYWIFCLSYRSNICSLKQAKQQRQVEEKAKSPFPLHSNLTTPYHTPYMPLDKLTGGHSSFQAFLLVQSCICIHVVYLFHFYRNELIPSTFSEDATTEINLILFSSFLIFPIGNEPPCTSRYRPLPC